MKIAVPEFGKGAYMAFLLMVLIGSLFLNYGCTSKQLFKINGDFAIGEIEIVRGEPDRDITGNRSDIQERHVRNYRRITSPDSIFEKMKAKWGGN